MAKAKGKGAYMISAVAEMYEIHPQTLRLYEREGLLAPSRSEGNTRLYTEEDIERLEVILQLTRELGVNLAGVEIILNMREKMAAMQRQMEQFVAAMNQEVSQHLQQGRREEAGPMLMRVATSSEIEPVRKRNKRD
jgi:MerR family transcriptional regulator/heat shock protein HspR